MSKNNQDNFNKAYSILNKAQKSAVDQIDGPVMVIAGPGTGKTQVLATRIANILRKTDTDPRAILALTFTESAAANMRERLVKMIGKTGYYVQITTFHSFCAEIISSYEEYFDIDPASEPLSDLERYDFFSRIIGELNLEVLKPINSPLLYLNDAMSAISNLKRENISLDEYTDLIEEEAQDLELDLKKTDRKKLEKKIAKNKELSLIYDRYQKMLRENLRYDFDDMISLVVSAFSQHEDLLLEYQENILYFLVDEYQDTNSAQNKIVDLLAYSEQWQENANIFVVGDPNQSIYRFQGASVENALSFTDKYPNAKIITLTTGYRCPQNIYNAAHQLISQNNLTKEDSIEPTLNKRRVEILEELNKKLEAISKVDSQMNIVRNPSKTVEIINVADEIKGLIKDGVKAKDIAVLYKVNADSQEIKEVMQKWQIPFEVDANNNVLESKEINQLISFLRIINFINEDDRELDIFEVLNYDWLGLDPLPIMKLTKIASLNDKSILELLDKKYADISDQAQEFSFEESEFESLKLFLEKLRSWKNADANQVFTDWFENLLATSGFLSFIKGKHNSLELITQLKSLFDQIKSLNKSNHQLKLNGFLNALDLMSEHNIAISSENIALDTNAVHLSTVHKAKGQEWDYVFLIDLVDKRWGNGRKMERLPLPQSVLKNTDVNKKESNEDDRRLFYVAITRAKKRLSLSWSESKSNGNLQKQQVESMFLTEFGEEIDKKIDEIKEVSEEKLLKLIEPVEQHNMSGDEGKNEQAFYDKILSKFVLSSTSLNSYLRNPKEFVENTLLRIPRAKPPHMSFGTAVHGALEFFYREYKNSGAFPTKEQLITNFTYQLSKEVLQTQERKRREILGKEILTTYFDKHHQSNPEVFDLERMFGGSRNRVILENDILLSGRIDRIDWIDKGKKLVKVVDYKTGKPKSDNAINGISNLQDYSERELSLPESIRGAYKRQLLFYKLLTDLDQKFPYKVTHASFEFIQPNQTGKQITRLFELSDEDVSDLKKLIVEVMAEIRELNFSSILKEK